MTYQSLEEAGLIEHYQVPRSEIEELLRVAHRDVRTAQELMDIDPDWALIVAYNASLQAGFALMYARGYRPKGPNRHKTVIRFLRVTLDRSFKSRINRLDRIRRKRHQAVYRLAGGISEREAGSTIEFAEQFVSHLAGLAVGKASAEKESE